MFPPAASASAHPAGTGWSCRCAAAWKKDWVCCLVLFAAAVLVYAPALGGEFLWDDAALVSGNRLIRSPVFFAEAFRHWLFLENPSLHYRPLQTLSFIVDYWFWGNDPFGYHLTNVALHGAAACLLFLLVGRLLSAGETGGVTKSGEDASDTSAPWWQTRNLAFVAALLWAVHPSHNAAVAYISGRADSLAFAFAAFGWLCLLPSREREESLARGVVRGVLGAVSLFCALASRESAACWIVLLGISTAFFTPRAGRRDFWRVGIAVTVALGAYVGLRLALPPLGPTPAPPNFDPLARVLLCIRALGGYIQILGWPAKLMMDRQLGCEDRLLNVAHSSRDPGLWLAVQTVAGAGLIAFLVFGFCRRGSGRAWRRLGTLWFLVGFLPVSNLLPLNASVAEHWLYLPSVGLLLVAAGWWRELPRGGKPWLGWIVPAAALLCVSAFGVRTFFRSADWADARTFYGKNIENGGGSIRICYNYAAACARAGDLPEAERTLTDLLKRQPDYLLGRVLLDRIAAYRTPPTAEERNLRLWTLREEARAKATPLARIQELQLTMQLAESLARANQPGSALAMIDEQIAATPRAGEPDWKLLAFRSSLLSSLGRSPEALEAVTAFAQTHWWHQDAQLLRADLLAKLGEPPAALATLAAADRLDVRSPAALNRMAGIYLQAGNLARALDCQQAALNIAPGQPGQHRLLGAIFTQLQRPTEAREQFAVADRLEAPSGPLRATGSSAPAAAVFN